MSFKVEADGELGDGVVGLFGKGRERPLNWQRRTNGDDNRAVQNHMMTGPLHGKKPLAW